MRKRSESMRSRISPKVMVMRTGKALAPFAALELEAACLAKRLAGEQTN
jgi:hypothetical protein